MLGYYSDIVLDSYSTKPLHRPTLRPPLEVVPMKDFPACLNFLMTCSLQSLETFEMTRLSQASDLLRELISLAADLARTQAEAEVAHLLLRDLHDFHAPRAA